MNRVPLESVPEVRAREPAAEDAALRASALSGLSLRAKAIVTFLGLIAYLAVLGLYVAHDRLRLLHIVQQLESVHKQQESLVRVSSLLAHIVIETQYLLNSSGAHWVSADLRIDTDERLHALLEPVKALHSEIAPGITRFERQAAELRAGDTPERLRLLSGSAQELGEQLAKIETAVEERVAVLTRQYSELNQSGSWYAGLMAISGVALFGAGVTLFFTRLASDVHQLKARAIAIVEGYRGPAIKTRRRDEVGALGVALNTLQAALRRSERKQAISWQHRFHQERLAVVGSLASAVAHEIGNPIGSISGIAQVTLEDLRSDQRPNDKALSDRAELIIKQTERIRFVVRQIADFSSPHSAEPELLDANELVRTTCNFVRYDVRFRGIDVVLDLAPADSLPALFTVVDHLTQVLMNLMLNAADATLGVADRHPTIRVTTREEHGHFVLSVIDNGKGMPADVLARAFDESFTTKSAAKGRGIGLYLCKMLIEDMNGRVELESTLGVGSIARTRLPLRPSDPGNTA